MCGPIEPDQLGFTLTHEHLDHDATNEKFHPRRPDPKYEHIANRQFQCQDRWWIDFHP